MTGESYKFRENRWGESLLYLMAQMKFYPNFLHFIPIRKKNSVQETSTKAH